MLGAVLNIFKIPDLRNKILFTIALLIIYRIGFHIPIPCFDQTMIQEVAGNRDEGPLGRAAYMMQMFTGGTLSQSSVFGLGIMPYITASIILMLLGEIVPALKKLRQEGQTGLHMGSRADRPGNPEDHLRRAVQRGEQVRQRSQEPRRQEG